MNFYLAGTIKLNEDNVLSAEFFTGNSSSADDQQLIISAIHNVFSGRSRLAIGAAFEFRVGIPGVIGAYRYEINEKLKFVSKAGLFLTKFALDDPSLILSSSFIYLASKSFSFLGEFNYSDEGLSRILINENILTTSVVLTI